MSLHEVRYQLEHRMLPGWFYGEGARLIGVLEQDQAFLYKVMNRLLEQEGIANPYRAEQFQATFVSVNESVMALRLTLPEPEDEPLCYELVMIFDRNYTRTGFYTIEKGSGVGVERMFLCGWDRDWSHQNYGSCAPDREQAFRRILEIYQNRETDKRA